MSNDILHAPLNDWLTLCSNAWIPLKTYFLQKFSFINFRFFPHRKPSAFSMRSDVSRLKDRRRVSTIEWTQKIFIFIYNSVYETVLWACSVQANAKNSLVSNISERKYTPPFTERMNEFQMSVYMSVRIIRKIMKNTRLCGASMTLLFDADKHIQTETFIPRNIFIEHSKRFSTVYFTRCSRKS